jgi:hypothetical protein
MLVYFVTCWYILQPFGKFIWLFSIFMTIWYTYSSAIWSILCSFGIFYGHVVYFMAIWYILWPFGILNGHLVYLGHLVFVLIWYMYCFGMQKPINLWQPGRDRDFVGMYRAQRMEEKVVWLEARLNRSQNRLMYVCVADCRKCLGGFLCIVIFLKFMYCSMF